MPELRHPATTERRRAMTLPSPPVYWLNVYSGFVWREHGEYRGRQVLCFAGRPGAPAAWPATRHESMIKHEDLCAPIWMRTAKPVAPEP